MKIPGLQFQDMGGNSASISGYARVVIDDGRESKLVVSYKDVTLS